VPDISLWTLLFLVIAAFAAGWIDAVVGGGGLLQLPAMLLGLPNASPAQILSTNKISSLCGTTTSAVTFGVKVRPDRKTVLPLAILAGLGAATGALVATKIPMSWFKPIVLVLLVVVGIYTAMKPSLGARTALRFDGRDHYPRGADRGRARQPVRPHHLPGRGLRADPSPGIRRVLRQLTYLRTGSAPAIRRTHGRRHAQVY
jgi:uncharacterized membrane protein YfcA